jgi:hypothetical protein
LTKTRLSLAAFGLLGLLGGSHYAAYRLAAPSAPAAPTSPFAKLGQAHAATLPASWAQGLRTAASVLKAGGSMTDAQAAKLAAETATRAKSFDQVVSPELDKIAPNGGELSPVQKASYADSLLAMADAVDPVKPKASGPQVIRGPPAIVGGQNLTGWVDNPDRFALAELSGIRDLTQSAPNLVGAIGDGDEDVFLYKAWKDVLGKYPDYVAQAIGDCTSFGSSHALDLGQCIDASIGGKPTDYRETSTEVTYGLSREVAGLLHTRSDGSYGVATAKALLTMGALPREAVGDGQYDGRRAKQFGTTGVPAELKSKAIAYKLGAAALVTTQAEAAAAIRAGHPFIVCSNQGFSMVRDATGLCRAQGSWAHCMFVCGVRVRGGRTQFCIAQSWGPQTPSGPLADDQPPFSFWAEGAVVDRMLAERDSLAFSDAPAFAKKAIPDKWKHSGFAEPAPKHSSSRPAPATLPIRPASTQPTPSRRKAA